MSYELEKIRTLSQGNGSYKTELYPKTLIDAVYSVNGEKLEDLMYQTISDEISKFATGDLSSSYALKKDVYNKTEIDTKLEPLATHSEVNNKADKNHNHDEKYSSLYHEHDQYALRSTVDTSLFELERDLIGGAPDELNTLGKLAMAIDNDDQFFNTISLEMNKKLNKSDFEGALDNYASLEHNHDERYYKMALTYSKDEVDALILGQSTDIVTRFALKTELTSAVDTINNNLTNNYLKTTQIESKLFEKVDKVDGKGLSTNDFTTELLTKLNGIEESANNYIHPESHPATMITGLHNVATSGDYRQLNNTPTNLSDFTNDCDFTTNAELNKVDTRITNLIGGTLPGGLQTIRQICLSINDDPAFAQTVATNLQNKANDLTRDYETRISNLETTLNTTIQTEVNTLNDKIIAIYGTESDKTNLKNLKLDTLRAIVTSIGEKTDLIGYIDENLELLETKIEESNSDYTEIINNLYGGEGEKEKLEEIGLSTLKAIANAINNDKDFYTNISSDISEVDNKVIALETKHDSDITGIYGADKDNRDFSYNTLLSINNTLSEDGIFYNFVLSEDEKNLKSANSYTNEVKNTIYGIPEGEVLTDNFKSLYNIQETVTEFIGDITDSSNGILKQSKDYTDSKVLELIDNAPESLNTLNKIAMAINNDPTFATTVTTNIEKIDTRVTNLISGSLDKKEIKTATNLYNIEKIVESLDDKENVITYINNEDDIVRSDIRGTGDITDYNTLTNIKSSVLGIKTELENSISGTLTDSKNYTDQEINKIKGNPPTTLDTLEEIAASINNQTDYDNYIQGIIKTEDNKVKSDIKGSATDEELQGYNTLTNIKNTVEEIETTLTSNITSNSASINSINTSLSENGDFYRFVTESDNSILTSANNYTNSVKNEIYGNTSEENLLDDYKSLYNIQETVQSLFEGINDESTGILKQSKNYTDQEINKIKGNSEDLTGYSTLSEIKTTVEGYNTTLTEDLNDLLCKHNREISDIYGQENKNFTYNSLKLINETLLENGNFHNFVLDEDEKTLDSAKIYTNTTKTNIYGVPEGKTISDEFSTIYNIQEYIINNFSSINGEADNNLKLAKSYTDEKIANLINGAPDALDTLKELAAALGNDNDFAANITNNISNINTRITKLIKGSTEDKQIENAVNLYNIEKIVTSLDDKSDVISYIEEQDNQVRSDIKGGDLTKPNNYSTLKNIETTVEGYNTALTSSINTLTSDNTTAHNEITNSISALKGGDLPSDLPTVLAIATTLSEGGTFRNYVDVADSTLQGNINTLETTVTKNEGTMNAVSSRLTNYITSNNEKITNLEAADTNILSYIKGIVGDGLTAISAQNLTTINKIVKALHDDENFHNTVSENLNNAITKLTTDEITPLENKVEAHLKEFSSYKTNIEEAYTQADNTLHTTITGEIAAAINNAVTDLKGNVTSNNNTLGKLETNIKAVSDTVNANKTALEEKINNTKAEILGNVTEDNNTLEKLEATITNTKSNILGNVTDDNNTLGKLEATISTSKRDLVDAINTAKSGIIDTATENYNTLGKIQAILSDRMTEQDVIDLMTNTFSEYNPSTTI